MAAPTTTTKFMTEPKAIYPLSTNNLEFLAEYSPNAETPDALRSKVALSAGSFFTAITTATAVPERRWSTVQVSENEHVELNSALLYMNHSCIPSLELDTSRMEVRVSRTRDLKFGDELNFFYPSTEWEMDKHFACLCGAGNECLGTLRGAAHIDVSSLRLKGHFINDHILRLKSQQQR
ncbi:hypothetical protein H2198_008357 [Neophaeococcomyces mojaviensis]|uniref:Uncharacterized protein n=1 Tax=Neophaeococcomyces mojaviensis TaxID=3383035 RepID=A0ACC2ZXM3_9EURO|nr:hypothetical protein H2198_008357 [Knufia sp. JES_112]